MNVQKISRYPGIRAFETQECDLFFGRHAEIQKLHAQVKAQSLVVLFAKSGIGKSSLINAGLIPVLEREYFKVVKIRLQDTSTAPVQTVKNALEVFVDHDLLSKYKKSAANELDLWEYAKSCEKEDHFLILVFDQFEEFFEHPKSEQLKLTVELADLINNRLPNRIQESLRSTAFTQRTEEYLKWHSPVRVKVLIAIRSDRISLLDDMSNEIPGILHQRFHLRALNQEQAQSAIIEPALLEGDNYSTAPFKYAPGTLQKILGFLSNSKGEIESFQLQLVCHRIEQEILERHGK